MSPAPRLRALQYAMVFHAVATLHRLPGGGGPHIHTLGWLANHHIHTPPLEVNDFQTRADDAPYSATLAQLLTDMHRAATPLIELDEAMRFRPAAPGSRRPSHRVMGEIIAIRLFNDRAAQQVWSLTGQQLGELCRACAALTKRDGAAFLTASPLSRITAMGLADHADAVSWPTATTSRIIRVACNHDPHATRVAARFGRGESIDEIADATGLSHDRVKEHLREVLFPLERHFNEQTRRRPQHRCRIHPSPLVSVGWDGITGTSCHACRTQLNRMTAALRTALPSRKPTGWQ